MKFKNIFYYDFIIFKNKYKVSKMIGIELNLINIANKAKAKLL